MSRRGGGGGAGRYADKMLSTMSLHFMIPFYLISNMTMFLKVEFLPIYHIPMGVVGDSGQNVCYHGAAPRDSL